MKLSMKLLPLGVAASVGVVGFSVPAAYAVPTKKAVGHWTFNVEWTKGPFKGYGGVTGITFTKDGTFTTTGGEYGTWTQPAKGKLAFAYTPSINGGCAASYTGKWHGKLDEWKGRMTTNCSTPMSSGTWSMGSASAAPAVTSPGVANPRG
jgi:hypothetical protein